MKLGIKGDNSVDKLDATRRRALWGFLDAFVAWQMADILKTLFPELPEHYGFALMVASLAGFAGFLWYGYQLWQMQEAAKADPALEASLNDERTRQLRNASLAFGFWTVLIYMAAMRLLDLVGWIPQHGPFWQLGIVIAVAAMIGHYLFKEWRDDE